MRTALALLTILIAATPAAAGGFIDKVPDMPAGYEGCLKRPDLCPGYQPPPFLVAPPRHWPSPSIEEMRHQELIDAIKELDRDLNR